MSMLAGQSLDVSFMKCNCFCLNVSHSLANVRGEVTL